MRILIVGAGAVGGYFGARLIEAGTDVTFLVRATRAEQLTRDGLVVESPFGNFRRDVKTITSCRDIDPPDIIIVACKAFGLDGALDAVAPCAGSGTVILPLLNGIAHLETIKQRFPNSTIWGGLAHIGVALMPDGTIRHLNRLHSLTFGSGDGASRPTEERLLAAFETSSVNAKLSRNIIQDLWDKLVFLATLAGSTCLMRADVGTILDTESGEEFILGLLSECSAIAKAEGFPPDRDQMNIYRQHLTEKGSTTTASMLRDIQAGRPTEAEHIVGDLVSRAAHHGVSSPLLGTAYAHLQAYESWRLVPEND